MLRLLLLVVVVVVTAALPPSFSSRWVLLVLRPDDGTATVLHHRPSRRPLGPPPPTPSTDWYVDNDVTAAALLLIPLPLSANSYYEHYDTDLHGAGGRTRLVTVEVGIEVPLGTATIRVTHRPTNTTSRLHLPTTFFASSSSSDGGRYLLDAAIVTGQPHRQTNVVFLSGGYTEESKFRDDLSRCVSFLQNGLDDLTHSLSSQPYQRYFTTLNIFAVFQASVASGARGPNNLDCAYGVNVERQLVCSRVKAQTLASLAPAADLIVTLVNDKTYGGTGGSGMAFVYTGTYMLHILLHEMGHALALLSDEYDFGFNEPGDVPLVNCARSADAPPWRAWMDTRVLGRPKQVCSYTNYFKAQGMCIMEGLNPGYCLVCKEATVRKMYAKPFDLLAPRCPMPGEIVTVYVTETFDIFVDRRVLMSQRSLDNTGAFNASYRVGNVGPWNAVVAIPLQLIAREYGVGRHTVTMRVEDRTNLVSNPLPTMTQESEFTLVVVDNIVDFTKANCSYVNNKHCKHATPYCTRCSSNNGSCTVDLSIRPFQVTRTSHAAAEIGQQFHWIILAGVAAALVLFAFTVALRRYAKRHVLRLVELPKHALVIRLTLLAGCLAIMVCSGAGATLVYQMYLRYSVYGKTILIAFFAYWIGLFVFAYLGFTGAYLRRASILFLTSGSMFAVFAVTMAMVVWCFHAYVAQDSFLQPTLSESWLDKTATEPALVCTFQEQFACSGFNNSCVANSESSFCPSDCEVANLNPQPCWYKLKDEVCSYFLYAAVTMICVNTGVLAVCVMAAHLGRQVRLVVHRLTVSRMTLSSGTAHNVLSVSEIRFVKDRFRELDVGRDGYLEVGQVHEFLQREMGERHLPDTTIVDIMGDYDDGHDGRIDESDFLAIYCGVLGKSIPHNIGDLIVIEDNIVRNLWRQFRKVDVHKRNSLDRNEFKVFYEVVMGEKVTPQGIDEIFELLDMEENGVLTFREFLLIYNPHVQLQYFGAGGTWTAAQSKTLPATTFRRSIAAASRPLLDITPRKLSSIELEQEEEGAGRMPPPPPPTSERPSSSDAQHRSVFY